VGALWVRSDVRLAAQIEGGIEESGRRGGTQSAAGLAGFAAACDASTEDAAAWERIDGLGRWLQETLLGDDRLAPIHLNGHPERRLRALVHVSCAGVDGEALIVRLAQQGVAASSGSSCVSEIGKPSHVLRAMGVPADLARGSLLLALGPMNTLEEIRHVADLIPGAVTALRGLAPRSPSA
jgi:cysteine desulfurase